MYSLFNIQQSASQGIMHLSEWVYLKNGLQRNLSQVVHFYRNNPMAVHSDHFLVKLLQSITIPQSQHLERYYNNVDALALNLSASLHMHSSIHHGKLFDGVFFGKGNDEILVAHTDSFDLKEANEKWKDLSPVRILRHFRSDLGFNLPDGNNTGSEEGLSVIAINIPMLAIQYRAFRFNEIKINSNENGEVVDSTLSCAHFIHMYVLPNAMLSYLDHVVFNRISNLEFGIPLGESSRKHSFFLTDFSAKMTYVHNEILNVLKKQNKDFTGILRNIPVVSCDNADKLMELPDMALTRQILPSLVVSRLPELKFLCRISRDSIGNKNQSEINRILRYITQYRSDNLFRQFPLDVYQDIMEDVEDIEKILKIIQ